MFSKIMVPVDLSHTDKLSHALRVASDLAKQYQAEVCYVGVTTNTPGPIAHTPEEYAGKLQQFAAGQSAALGHRASSHAMVSHDPAIDLDETLVRAVKELGADVVVMATHIPGMADMILPSHGGHLASHSGASVFLVRGH